MFKTLVVLMVLFAVSGASGGDFILRPTSECCTGGEGFKEGSRAVLFHGDSIHGQAKLSAESYFLFANIAAGEYDLAIAVEGYYPEKFFGLEVGKGGIFDFEFVAPLQPTGQTPILEGHIIVRFKRTISHEDIFKRLDKWGLDVLQESRNRDGSPKPPQHAITTMHKYLEIRAGYDRSRDLAELIWTALQDPAVVECMPFYFSKRE